MTDNIATDKISSYLESPLKDLQNLYTQLYEIQCKTPKESLLKKIEEDFVLPILKQNKSQNLLVNFEKYLYLLWSVSTTIISDEIYDIFTNCLIKHGLLFNMSNIKKKYYPHRIQDAKKICKIYGQNNILMPKIDGVSGILIFLKDKIVLTTKQREGKFRDISHRLPLLDCYPILQTIHERVNSDLIWARGLVLRGEIIVKDSHLSEEEKLKSRSLATGFVMTKKTIKNTEHPVSFIVFDAHFPDNQNDVYYNINERLDFVKKVSLETVPIVQKVFESDKDDLASTTFWKKIKDDFRSDYSLDGVVVTNEIGEPHFAVKFSTEDIIVEVLDIIWQYKQDYYTPIVVFTPFQRGAVYNKVSMSNYSKLVRNNVHVGSTISVNLIGETSITYLKTVKYNPNNTYQDYKFPENSVICDITNKLIKKDNDSNIISFTSFQHFLKYLNVVGIGKTYAKHIYDCLQSTDTIDNIITSMRNIGEDTGLVIRISDIYHKLEYGIGLSEILSLVPDPVRITPAIIKKYFTENSHLIFRLQSPHIPWNIDEEIVISPCFGIIKIEALKRKIKKFIEWNTKLIKIDYKK